MTFSWAATPELPQTKSAAAASATRPTLRIRLTILHALAALLLVVFRVPVFAQSPAALDDPFAARRWHFEADTNAALEAWNYNGSHEELYGLNESVTYGLRDGFLLRAGQHVTYVSQRGNDAWVLGLTFGVRGRIYHRNGVAVFLQGDLGISDTAIATPPRGTRFNYLAFGGTGVLVPLRPRMHLVTTLQLTHISNAGLKGPGRNPDIEAIGLSLGLMVRF